MLELFLRFSLLKVRTIAFKPTWLGQSMLVVLTFNQKSVFKNVPVTACNWYFIKIDVELFLNS